MLTKKRVIDLNPNFVEYANVDVIATNRETIVPVVYVMHIRGTDFVKIGSASKIRSRMQVLQSATPHDVALVFAATTGTFGLMICAELSAHSALAKHRIRGEWFSCGPAAAIYEVRNAIQKLREGAL